MSLGQDRAWLRKETSRSESRHSGLLVRRANQPPIRRLCCGTKPIRDPSKEGRRFAEVARHASTIPNSRCGDVPRAGMASTPIGGRLPGRILIGTVCQAGGLRPPKRLRFRRPPASSCELYQLLRLRGLRRSEDVRRKRQDLPHPCQMSSNSRWLNSGVITGVLGTSAVTAWRHSPQRRLPWPQLQFGHATID